MILWPWLLAGLAFALALASAAVSALETALFSLSEDQRTILRRSTRGQGRELMVLLEHPRKTLNAILLADCILNLSLIFCVLVVVQQPALFPAVPDWILGTAVFLLVGLACELLPKMVALASPLRLCQAGGPLVLFLHNLLERPAVAMEHFSDKLVRHYSPEGARSANALELDEFLTLIEVSRQEGSLREMEGRALAEIVKLGDETASHCMTPRVDLFTVPDDLTNEEVTDLIRTRRYARVLVTGETPDDLVGVLGVREFLLHSETPYLEQLQPPAFVPETIPALNLFNNFLHRRQHMAILLDEYGGIEGVVTLSDFIEEIFGEEGPGARVSLYIEELAGSRILANGNAKLDDLEAYLGPEVRSDSIESIGGLLIQQTGHVPRPGTSVEIGDWTATVRRATRKRVKEVILEKRPEEAPTP